MWKNRYFAVLVAFLAVAYQCWLRTVFFVTLGIGRVVQPIERFPFKCRRLEDERLDGCGAMWLDEKYRVLYAACSGVKGRDAWDPSLSKFNYTGRRPEGTRLMAIYVDEPLKNGLFKMHPIQPTNYGSKPGDGKLDIVGLDVELLDYGSTHRFWLINQRAPYDMNGIMLDAKKHGANTTVDVYEHRKGDKKMKFLATGWSPSMHSANSIAFMGSNNFVVSNDRSAQLGLRKKLDPIIGGGSLVYHDDWWDHYRETQLSVQMQGALARGLDDRIYVPSLVDGKIRVFELQESALFKQVHVIKLGMPIVGLTVDSVGDLWAVGRSRYSATGRSSTNTIFKIEKFEEKRYRYVVHRVLEDSRKTYLDGASVARHDVKTKRIFFAGAYMRYLAVCEPR